MLRLPFILGLFWALAFASPARADDTVRVIPAAEQKRYAQGGAEVRMQVEKAKGAYVGRLRFEAGAKVPPHRHADSEEILSILSGVGVVHIGGKAVPVKAGDAVYIPKNVEHDFVTGDGPLEAVQVYSPAGPEDRFRQWPSVEK